MRSAQDLCLLCKVNLANKTNSHILPRFISTNFLGPKGSPQKGYLLNRNSEIGKKPKTVQDSPKEDFILCEECEAYFPHFEGISADTFNNWQQKVNDNNFSFTEVNKDIALVDCLSSDPNIIRLFVYSMFWRASISSLDLFNEYRLEPKIEESLRTSLLLVKGLRPAEIFQKLKNHKILSHPYSILTAKEFKNESANVLAAINSSKPAGLHVDRFGFLLFENKRDMQVDFIREFSNVYEKECKIMVLGENLWHDLMVERPIGMLIEEIKQENK